MLTVLVPREAERDETRVASTPEVIKRLAKRGITCLVERGAGLASGFPDEGYAEAGAQLLEPGDREAWSHAQVLLTVGNPGENFHHLKEGTLLIGQLAPHGNQALMGQLENRGLSAIALELLPRISRAQSMDVLSSQANIAGYKAVLLAAAQLDRFMPMLMTAAGTVQPARVLVIGAGVAGLQAVATARRLGALVKVSDVRAAAREQVESLGARFIEPPERGTPGEQGGYAKEATAAFLEAQRQQLAEHLLDCDIVICTAQVPGRPAPLLLTRELTGLLRPGAVVVDLAVAQGGNCELSVAGETVNHNGVLVIGADRLPASVAHHASSLYSRNLGALLEVLVTKEGELCLDPKDPLLEPCLISLKGQLLKPELVPALSNGQEVTP
ncbi:MAG: NAD(P) transhydrogenase subunit alpha [Synechococcus lacustris]